MNHKFGIALAGLTLGAAAFAQTKWDLPTAYPATNYHTENITQFAKDVDAATGGKLKITVHANASLFKAPEIKRAVQSGQAQAGEILLANFANENPIYALDGVPFLADQLPRSEEAVRGLQARAWRSCWPRRASRCCSWCRGRRRASTSRRRSARWPTCAASSGAPTARPRPRSPS